MRFVLFLEGKTAHPWDEEEPEVAPRIFEDEIEFAAEDDGSDECKDFKC